MGLIVQMVTDCINFSTFTTAEKLVIKDDYQSKLSLSTEIVYVTPDSQINQSPTTILCQVTTARLWHNYIETAHSLVTKNTSFKTRRSVNIT
jgi:hypothetical protein